MARNGPQGSSLGLRLEALASCCVASALYLPLSGPQWSHGCCGTIGAPLLPVDSGSPNPNGAEGRAGRRSAGLRFFAALK